MSLDLKLSGYHFLKSVPKLGVYNALKLQLCKLLDVDVKLRVKGVSNSIFLPGGTSDYHAFYTTFIRDDYPEIGVGKPDLVLDLGANLGYASILFSSRYPDCKILSVEADRENFYELRSNTRHYQNIHCMENAVYGESGEYVRFGGKDSISKHILNNVCQGTSDSEQYVKTISVSDLFDYAFDLWGPIKGNIWVKMDIEGSEVDVFKGQADWLNQCRLLYIEIHSGCWKSVFDRLTCFSYDCEVRGETIIFKLEGN